MNGDEVLLPDALLSELRCDLLEAWFVLVSGTTAWFLPSLFRASVPLVRSESM